DEMAMETRTIIDEYLYNLHGSLDPGEEIYLAPADNPEACIAVNDLARATAIATEWQSRGVFISTGTFQAGTARKRQHLLSIPALVLDADFKSRLMAQGMSDAEAEQKIRTCPPAILEKLCASHRQLILSTLAQLGIDPSSLIFTGGGHHVYL